MPSHRILDTNFIYYVLRGTHNTRHQTRIHIFTELNGGYKCCCELKQLEPADNSDVDDKWISHFVDNPMESKPHDFCNACLQVARKTPEGNLMLTAFAVLMLRRRKEQKLDA